MVCCGTRTASVSGWFIAGTELSVRESESEKHGGRTPSHNGGKTTDRWIG